MLVLSVYLARSNVGNGVVVGRGVSVGTAGVFVKGDVTKTGSVGVARSAGCAGAQAEMVRKIKRRKKMYFERMGAILP